MKTQTPDRKMGTPETFLTAGVAGHLDHGKTSLVRCLTGVDTDRLKEEKRRGLTIEPGVASLQLPSGRPIALVDVPGHRGFLKNTVRGLSNVDLAVLVVAADDGVMAQTRDHLEVLRFLEAKSGIVVISKADLVDGETLELAEMEIREILDGSFLEGKPLIPFSAAKGTGLDQILHAMESEAGCVEGKTHQAPFRLWVDQVRSFSDFGTVVSGTVLSGCIRRDAEVDLLPSGKQAKVSFIEAHHQRVDQAVAGQRIGVNLQGIASDEVSLGTVVAEPGYLRPARFINAELSLVPTARRPLRNRQRVKLYIGTCCTTALLVMMEADKLHPGQTALVQFRLSNPLAVLPRDPFVISPLNLHSIAGGGRILEIPQEKFRVSKARRTLDYLQPLQQDDVKTILQFYFSKFAGRPVTVEEIACSTGFSAESIQAAIRSRMRKGKLIHLEGRGYFDGNYYARLKGRLVDVTKKILLRDPCMSAASRDEMRLQLDPELDEAPFQLMLSELCAEGKLTKTEAGYRIPNFVVRHPAQLEKLMDKVIEFARSQGYGTFSVGTYWKLHGDGFAFKDVEKIVDRLEAQKKLIRLRDDRFITTEAMQEIQQKVKELILRKGSFSIHDSREILGYGRTRAIAIFDYLDSIGLTRRVGDNHVLAQGHGAMRNTGHMQPGAAPKTSSIDQGLRA